MKYFPTIGLEIHVELKTQAKMFCQCANNFDEASPNVNICPICMGQPGALPAGVNEKAAEQTLKICLALRCSICEAPQFWRKNYFYPDLPKGYQITSQKSPFGERGFVKQMKAEWVFIISTLKKIRPVCCIPREHLIL